MRDTISIHTLAFRVAIMLERGAFTPWFSIIASGLLATLSSLSHILRDQLFGRAYGHNWSRTAADSALSHRCSDRGVTCADIRAVLVSTATGLDEQFHETKHIDMLRGQRPIEPTGFVVLAVDIVAVLRAAHFVAYADQGHSQRWHGAGQEILYLPVARVLHRGIVRRTLDASVSASIVVSAVAVTKLTLASASRSYPGQSLAMALVGLAIGTVFGDGRKPAASVHVV
jgi:hypothetical protein